MSDFTVPIQERDDVNLQDANVPMSNKSIVTPITTDLGAGLDSVANNIQTQQQAIAKKARIIARANFENQRDASVEDANSKVVAAQGENSFVVADQAQKELQHNLDQQLAQAPNIYKADFTNLANQGINRFNKVSQGHQYRQANIVADNIFKDRSDYLTSQIVGSAHNLDDFNTNRALLNQVTEQYVKQKMGGVDGVVSPQVQDAINAQKQGAQSTALLKTIESLVSYKDLDTAQGYADHFKDEINANDQIKVNNLLNKGQKSATSDKAQALMEEAMGAGPDPTMQMDYIRKHSNGDGDVYKQATSMLITQKNFAEDQRKKNMAKSEADVMDSVRKNGGYLTPDLKAKLDPESYAKVVDYGVKVSENKTIPRDPNTFWKIQNMYLNSPEEFKRLDPEQIKAMAHKLPYSDVQNFLGMLKQSQNPDASKTTSKSVSDITANLIKSQVATKYAYNSDEYKRGSAEIQAKANEVFSQVLLSLPERPSPQDVRDAFAKEMSLRTQRGELSGWDKFMNHVPFTTKKEAPMNQNSTGLFNSYDPTIVDQVRSGLQQRNKSSDDMSTLKVLRTLKAKGHI